MFSAWPKSYQNCSHIFTLDVGCPRLKLQMLVKNKIVYLNYSIYFNFAFLCRGAKRLKYILHLTYNPKMSKTQNRTFQFKTNSQKCLNSYILNTSLSGNTKRVDF